MATYKSSNQQNFLKSFVSDAKKYETTQVNGFILEKHYDANVKDWLISVYTAASFKKRQEYLHGSPEQNHLLDIMQNG